LLLGLWRTHEDEEAWAGHDVLAEHMGHGHVTVRSADTVAGGWHLAIKAVKWGPRRQARKPMRPTWCVIVPGSNVLTAPRWLPEGVVS
jgi:hypothetical protein